MKKFAILAILVGSMSMTAYAQNASTTQSAAGGGGCCSSQMMQQCMQMMQSQSPSR